MNNEVWDERLAQAANEANARRVGADDLTRLLTAHRRNEPGSYEALRDCLEWTVHAYARPMLDRVSGKFIYKDELLGPLANALGEKIEYLRDHVDAPGQITIRRAAKYGRHPVEQYVCEELRRVRKEQRISARNEISEPPSTKSDRRKRLGTAKRRRGALAESYAQFLERTDRERCEATSARTKESLRPTVPRSLRGEDGANDGSVSLTKSGGFVSSSNGTVLDEESGADYQERPGRKRRNGNEVYRACPNSDQLVVDRKLDLASPPDLIKKLKGANRSLEELGKQLGYRKPDRGWRADFHALAYSTPQMIHRCYIVAADLGLSKEQCREINDCFREHEEARGALIAERDLNARILELADSGLPANVIAQMLKVRIHETAIEKRTGNDPIQRMTWRVVTVSEKDVRRLVRFMRKRAFALGYPPCYESSAHSRYYSAQFDPARAWAYTESELAAVSQKLPLLNDDGTPYTHGALESFWSKELADQYLREDDAHDTKNAPRMHKKKMQNKLHRET